MECSSGIVLLLRSIDYICKLHRVWYAANNHSETVHRYWRCS